MNVVHLVASPFLGGPEHQILNQALNLPGTYRSVFLMFGEGGRYRSLCDELNRHGFEVILLKHNAPHFLACIREVAMCLRRSGADVLCCHGYKPDIIGCFAAKRVGIPTIAVVHGWTAATPKVRLNEFLDRQILRWIDKVVCVSEGQAVKVRRLGVPADRLVVIRNTVRAEQFDCREPGGRERLRAFFPGACDRIVGAVGRLSPEKGFEVLVQAAAMVVRLDSRAGFMLFGDGPLREKLERQISAAGLRARFVLGGFRTDLATLIPHFDLLVLPSFTEGLPVAVLEALASGVPVVATAVGGTPEVVCDGQNGYLVAPGEPAALARRIFDALSDEARRAAMGAHGRQQVREHFAPAAQAAAFQRVYEELVARRRPHSLRKPLLTTEAPGTDPQRGGPVA